MVRLGCVLGDKAVECLGKGGLIESPSPSSRYQPLVLVAQRPLSPVETASGHSVASSCLEELGLQLLRARSPKQSLGGGSIYEWVAASA